MSAEVVVLECGNAEARALRLLAEAVDPADLPRFLLAQKRNLSPDRFYALVASGWKVHAFVLHERGQPRPVCCWFMAGSPLYEGLLIDTFVVDKPLRTEERVRACMRKTKDVCERLIRELGLPLFAWSTDRPERMMALLGDPRVRPVETTLVFHVEREGA